MKWKIASASARGSSHVRSGRPNQDACEHGTGAQGSPLKAVLAVSDGHGGSRHFRSEIGSRLAAHIAVSVLQESIAESSFPDEAVPPLIRKIVDDWRTAVLSDLAQHPFTPEEWAELETAEGSAAKTAVEEDPVLAYGATLLVVAAAETFMLYLQLGDGDILAVDAVGNTSRPLPSDDRLIANQTTSLCQPDSWKEFRTTIVRKPAEFASVVLASTDGYANSFRSDEDFLKIGRDYLNLVREDGLDALAEDLPNILAEASQQGSGDDITLSVLVSDAAYAVTEATGVPPASAPVPTQTPTPAPSPPPAAEPAAAAPRPVTGRVSASAPESRKRRFSPGQIRILALVALLVPGALLLQHYVQSPKKTEVKTGSPTPTATTTKKISNAPPQGKEWVLRTESGAHLPLRLGSKITVKELFGTKDKTLYADVTDDENVLRLMNRSEDPWTEERSGKETGEPVEAGSGVALGPNVKILFREKSATIGLADAPAGH
jgi:hypothetical protein